MSQSTAREIPAPRTMIERIIDAQFEFVVRWAMAPTCVYLGKVEYEALVDEIRPHLTKDGGAAEDAHGLVVNGLTIYRVDFLSHMNMGA